MMRRRRPLPPLGIDPFATACGFAGLSGALAWFTPYFRGSTFALAALSTVLWMSLVRVSVGRPKRSGARRRVGAPVAFATGWGVWVAGGLWFPAAGALALGVSALVAWWCSREISGRGGAMP